MFTLFIDGGHGCVQNMLGYAMYSNAWKGLRIWHLSAPFHSELLCEGYEVAVWSFYVHRCAATGGPRHAGPGAKMATSAGMVKKGQGADF